MITKCRFCDYQKQDTVDEKAMLKSFEAMQNDIHEDVLLHLETMFQTMSSKHWSGVKVHMGRMHKKETYVGIWPEIKLEEREIALVKSSPLYPKDEK